MCLLQKAKLQDVIEINAFTHIWFLCLCLKSYEHSFPRPRESHRPSVFVKLVLLVYLWISHLMSSCPSMVLQCDKFSSLSLSSRCWFLQWRLNACSHILFLVACGYLEQACHWKGEWSGEWCSHQSLEVTDRHPDQWLCLHLGNKSISRVKDMANLVMSAQILADVISRKQNTSFFKMTDMANLVMSAKILLLSF